MTTKKVNGTAVKVNIKNNLSDSNEKETLDRVAVKLVDLAYQNQLFGLLSSFIVVSLLLFYLSESIDDDILGGYLLLFYATFTFRGFLNWRHALKKRNNTDDVNQSKSLYLLGIGLTALAWSALIIFITPILNFEGQVLLVIAVLGVTGVAYTTMGFVKVAAPLHAILSIVPLTYVLSVSILPNSDGAVVAVIVYLIFVLRASSLFYNSMFNMLLANEIAQNREDELQMQTVEAQLANQQKSDFLSRMSHELRTPLNAILGMNELLMRDKKEPLSIKQSNRAEKVDAAGKHLLTIVNDVLDLSRIEAGQVIVNVEKVSCQNVIEASIKLVETKAAYKNVTIATDFPENIVHIMVDVNRIKQILVNLLDNAVKFNKTGGQVRVVLESDSGGLVRISIIDTGLGIPEDLFDDLFQPFSRLNADKLGIDGTGIGLSLSKQLIELMSGKIGVESSEGNGCCFWVDFPPCEQEVDEAPNMCNVSIKCNNNQTKEKMILLVEDNLVNCEVAIDMIDSMGFDTDVVNNGQQAVEAFSHGKHALILMDCEMPVLDGFAATAKIREIEIKLDQPRIPIIALTAHAITGARDKCIASGMDDFLSKPFSMSALQLMLNRWLPEANESAVNETENTSVEEPRKKAKKKTKQNNLLDESIINRLSSRKRKDGSVLLDTVVNIYFEQAAKLLTSLSVATEQKDAESIREISHALKSSSSNVGALGLAELCEQLEYNCEHGQINHDLINQVHQTYSSVIAALSIKLENTQH